MSARPSSRSSASGRWDERRALASRLVAGELREKGFDALESAFSDERIGREFGEQVAVDALLRFQAGHIGLSDRFRVDLPSRFAALRGTFRLFAAAAALLVAGLIGYAAWSRYGRTASPDLVAIVEKVRGAAHVAGRTLAAGDRLSPGHEVRVGEAGLVHLRYEDGTALSFLGNSIVDFCEGEQVRRLVTSQGRLEGRVPAQDASVRIMVQTPHSEISAGASTFAVDVAPARTRVEVDAGAVNVRLNRSAAWKRVSAGTYAEAGNGIELVARPHPSPRVRRALRIPGLVALYDLGRAPDRLVDDISGRGLAPRLKYAGPGEPERSADGWLLRYPQGAQTEGRGEKMAAHLADRDGFTVEVVFTPLEMPGEAMPGFPIVYVTASGSQKGKRARRQLGIVADEKERDSLGCRKRVTLTYVFANKHEALVYENGKHVDGPHEFPLDLKRDGIRVGIMGRLRQASAEAWSARYELLAVYDRVLDPSEIGRDAGAAGP